MKTDLFQSCGHCCIFQICWRVDCSTFTASSFRIWKSSGGYTSPLLFSPLLSLAVWKASSDNHFASLLFFFSGMVLFTASCTYYGSLSIVLQAYRLLDLIPWVYSSPPLHIHRGFDFAMRSWGSEPQSAPGLVFADCVQLLHLWLQRMKSISFQYWSLGEVHV